MKHKIIKIHLLLILHNKHQQVLNENELDDQQAIIQPQKKFEKLRHFLIDYLCIIYFYFFLYLFIDCLISLLVMIYSYSQCFFFINA
jgi:hypothetical protein